MAETWKRIVLEGEVVTLGDSSQLATSAAPTADADLANKKYVDDNVASGTDHVPIATSGDYTLPTGKCFVGGDEFSVEGTDTLSIEGTGRMILVG